MRADIKGALDRGGRLEKKKKQRKKQQPRLAIRLSTTTASRPEIGDRQEGGGKRKMRRWRRCRSRCRAPAFHFGLRFRTYSPQLFVAISQQDLLAPSLALVFACFFLVPFDVDRLSPVVASSRALVPEPGTTSSIAKEEEEEVAVIVLLLLLALLSSSVSARRSDHGSRRWWSS